MSKSRSRSGWKSRACVVALTVVVFASMALASTASALPAKFWGVVPQALPSQEQFGALQRGGVDSTRTAIDWSGVQPQRGGPIEWSGVDALVERAATSGVEVLPFLTGAPKWAVPSVRISGGGGSTAPAHLPATGAAASGWKAFLAAAVARYGPGGEFWATHPAVPVRPIRAWQIWNEQNFKYFVAKPNPAEYGKLIKLSYAAIKAADPGAQVVLGGMFARPKGSRVPGTEKHKSLNWFASDFLEAMYEKTPGVKTKFNGVALHPYTGKYQELTPEIEEFRAVLTANHDAAKGLWITELGWSSQSPTPTNIFAKGAGGQAAQLRGAFSLLRGKQAKWRIQRVYWFSVDDAAGACNFCDGSGLFGSGFKPKKAWFEFVKFAGGTA